MFAPASSITEKQAKLMYIALSHTHENSGKSYGLTTENSMGRKTIFNLGIPSKMIDSLRLKATLANELSGDRIQSYYDTPYICVHILKKCTLGGTLLYYPKPYIFNANKFILENSFSNKINSLQEEDYNEITSSSDLLEKISLYSLNKTTGVLESSSGYDAVLSNENDFDYYDTVGQLMSDTPKQDLKVEIKTNHMLDYYLKMYMKLTMGIDINELLFPLNLNNYLYI